MDVVFDDAKNVINIRKHGISLQRAEDFDWTAAHYDVDDSQDYGEVRYNVIGWLDASLYTLTFTQIGDNIRAISLRKSDPQEQRIYADEF
ncbi:MAG TPA: BrnT family toxin [Acidobacteriaceae bacterium]|nr:BrnT family toxin [Acidobacteriaceae bacterium]